MRKWGDLSTWVHHTALWHCWAMRRPWQNTNRLRLRVPDCNKNTLRSCLLHDKAEPLTPRPMLRDSVFSCRVPWTHFFP